MVDVTLFSAAGCGKCVATKAHLRKRGLSFTEVRADRNPVVAEHLKSANLMKLPVVMAFRGEDDEVPDVWSDYHPERIEDLAIAGAV